MQIHELPTISGSPSGGYFATDNGTQTTKIDYTALAQAIIEQYNASTLAGTAQSVKAALDGLDGDKLDLKAGTAITSGTDVNTLQTPGTYFCSSASIAASLSNIPSQATAVGFRLDVARNGYNNDNYLTQTLVGVRQGLSSEYVRAMSVKGTWGEWQKAPTRAEIDALSSNMANVTFTRTMATSSGVTVTIPNNYRGTLTVLDGAKDNCGFYLVRAYSNGQVNATPLFTETSVTIDTSTANKIVITSPGNSVCLFENITGTATV